MQRDQLWFVTSLEVMNAYLEDEVSGTGGPSVGGPLVTDCGSCDGPPLSTLALSSDKLGVRAGRNEN